MSVLESLIIQGFESYKKAEINFTKGLNLITGRNSSGKTTILDAIFFTLYGEIPGIDKKLLVTRLEGVPKSLYTSLRLRSQKGDLIEIHRWGKLLKTHGKESYHKVKEALLINGKQVPIASEEDLRRKIREIIGLSMKKFLNLVYVRQGELTKILKPKKEEMDSILGITVLRELKEQIDQARKELEKHEGQDVKTLIDILENENIPRMESELLSLENQIKTLKPDIERLKEVIEKAESQKLNELIKLIDKRDNLLEESIKEEAGIKANLQSIKASTLEELKTKLDEFLKRLEELKKLQESVKQNFEKIKAEKNGVEAILKKVEDEYKIHIKLLEEGKGFCPTCGQPITHETMDKVLEEDKKKIMDYMDRLEKLIKPFKQAEQEFNKLNEEVQNLKKEVEILSMLKKEVEARLVKINTLKSQINEVILRIKEYLQALSLQLNPEDKDLKAKVAEQLPLSPEKVKELHKELEEKSEKLEKAEKHKKELEEQAKKAKEKLEFLKKRLEKTKLLTYFIEKLNEGIEQIRKLKLHDISVEALSIYNSLTDQQIYKAFRINPETYEVEVQPEGLDVYIPATRVGGGHQTLIALALRFSILKVLGGGGLLILDEPTYGVDSENIPQLLNYISEASKKVSQVILVTHHEIGEEESSNIIKVEIGLDGSSQAKVFYS